MYIKPKGAHEVKVMEVIEVRTKYGEATNESPVREIIQYWNMDGFLLATIDPLIEANQIDSEEIKRIRKSLFSPVNL